MKLAAMGRFSAACRRREARRVATRTAPPARAGMRHRRLLELQWQGIDGRFRHLALGPPGWRRVAGAIAVVSLLALAVAGAFSAEPGRALARRGIDPVVRENAELRARQEALRERAFDLADLVDRSAEQGRRIATLAGVPSHASETPSAGPPADDAANEALLAWLSEQASRLDALGNELDAGRVETGVKQASLPEPDGGASAPGHDDAVPRVVGVGSAEPNAAPPPRP